MGKGTLAKIGLAVPVTIGNLITKGINLVAGKEIGKTTTIKEASETKFGKVLGTAITGVGAATAIAAVGASAAATASVAKVGKAVGSTALNIAKKNPLTTLIAAPIVYGAVKENPKEAAQVLVKAPGDLANFGSNVSDLIVDPSLEKAKETITENPILSAVIPTLAAAPLVRSVLPVITNIQTQEKIENLKEDLSKNVTAAPTTSNQVQTIPATTGSSSAAVTPVLPQTQTITATTGSSKSTKRKKSSRKALQSKISQQVRVNVVGVSSVNRITKKYINEIALRN